MADAIQKAKSGKKQRKYGRNAKWCQAYRLRNQRERNKIRRLIKHLKQFPDDAVAANAMATAKIAVRGYAD